MKSIAMCALRRIMQKFECHFFFSTRNSLIKDNTGHRIVGFIQSPVVVPISNMPIIDTVQNLIIFIFITKTPI